ncbi:hypothetical protein U9M48_033199 [Paspalum notatum var. saurae]|uniref:Uncharacterized protein n=1 Tax=Paspalum notatum var. saurae TaxID=547442 RepID=A0AAQ3U7Q8_PASNO
MGCLFPGADVRLLNARHRWRQLCTSLRLPAVALVARSACVEGGLGMKTGEVLVLRESEEEDQATLSACKAG